jgi:beta-glucosidase
VRRVRFVDAAGVELFAEDRLKTAPLVWFGGAAPISESHVVELSTRYTPTESSHVRIGFAMVGRGRVWVDDRARHRRGAHRGRRRPRAAFLTPPSATTPITLTAGTPVDLRFQIDLGAHEDFLPARCRSSSAPSRTPRTTTR